MNICPVCGGWIGAEPHRLQDCVRYLKKQLRAKDATIAALVTALRLALRARSYVAHTNIYNAAWGKIKAAIKEATDAS